MQIVIIIINALLLCSYQQTLSDRAHSARLLGPLSTAYISSITVNNTYIYPTDLANKYTSCIGSSPVTVAAGQQIVVKSANPFVMFLTTQFAQQYYDSESYAALQQELSINAMINSVKQDSHHVARVPVKIKCRQKLQSYFQLTALIQADFYEEEKVDKKQFNFLLVCSTKEQIESFAQIYIPGYVIFWMYFNLSLMVYHNYFRDRYHFSMFLIYLAGSLLIGNSLLAYMYAGGIFLLVLLRQKRQNNISNKFFSLEILFVLMLVILVLYAYEDDGSNHLLNGFWVALDNFSTIHMTMFLVLRLVKLHRFRQVFWYFIAVSLLALLLQDQANRFFQLRFKNPLNLDCLKLNVFYGIMMLPISNFYTSITKWIHRVISLAIVICSVMPVRWSIKLMAVTFFLILFCQIRSKDVGVIRHIA